MVWTWNHGMDIDSWYRHGPQSIDMNSWYRHGLMVETWNHGIDMDSWHEHELMLLTTAMESV